LEELEQDQKKKDRNRARRKKITRQTPVSHVADSAGGEGRVVLKENKEVKMREKEHEEEESDAVEEGYVHDYGYPEKAKKLRTGQ